MQGRPPVAQLADAFYGWGWERRSPHEAPNLAAEAGQGHHGSVLRTRTLRSLLISLPSNPEGPQIAGFRFWAGSRTRARPGNAKWPLL